MEENDRRGTDTSCNACYEIIYVDVFQRVHRIECLNLDRESMVLIGRVRADCNPVRVDDWQVLVCHLLNFSTL